MATIRAHFDGRVLVPIDPVILPVGRLLEVEVREADALPKGSPALLLKVMAELPSLEPGDAEALEAAIEAGKMPVRYDSVFDAEG